MTTDGETVTQHVYIHNWLPVRRGRANWSSSDIFHHQLGGSAHRLAKVFVARAFVAEQSGMICLGTGRRRPHDRVEFLSESCCLGVLSLFSLSEF